MMKKKLPHLAAITTEVIWGFSYLSMKVIVNEINPILAALYRYIFASLILGIVFFAKGKKIRIHKEDRFHIVITGLLGITLYFIFENIGVKYTTTANVALILATIPVFTLLIENKRNSVRTPMKQFIGIVMSIVGIGMIILVKDRITFSLEGSFGDLMIMLASLSWVGYTYFLGHLKGEYDGLELTFYNTFIGTVFLMPALIFTGVQPLSSSALFHLLYLAVVCSGIAFAMYLYSLKTLGPVIVNTYINIQPVVTVIISIFILKEKLYPVQILGSVLIIIGVYIVSLYSDYSKDVSEKNKISKER